MKQVVKNNFSLTVPARSVNESFARTAVAAFVSQLDPTIDQINDIKTAVSEAVTNCIVHAYRESIGNIYIKAYIYTNNTVCIKIKDKGVGIDNVSKAMEPLFTTGAGERAGLGLSVMESFMDSLKVTSKKDKGTLVTMTKKISVRVSGNAK